MNFILMPSLEHRALVKIAIALWSPGDLRAEEPMEQRPSLKSKSSFSEDKWQGIENSVVKKASDLPIPEKLKKKLITIIGPVGLRIKLWLEFHNRDPVFNRPSMIKKFPAMLFWTPHGTIDNKKTAEALIKDETLDPYQRFAFASYYCLEDNIRDVFEKCSFRDCVRTKLIEDNTWTSFWYSYLKENVEIPSARTFEDDFGTFEELFENSATYGNEVAIRYLCFKLNPQRTEHIRMKTSLRLAGQCEYKRQESTISDCLFFLLSTMNAEQQANIIKFDTCAVLLSLLSWPWQCLFVETVKRNLHFLSKESYDNLSYKIVDRMHKSNNLQEVFGEFCQQTRESWQQFIREKNTLGCILLQLYKKKDENTIKFILKDICISSIDFGDNDRSRVGVTKFDSSGFTLRRRDCTEAKYKWDEIFQLIEYCIYG